MVGKVKERGGGETRVSGGWRERGSRLTAGETTGAGLEVVAKGRGVVLGGLAGEAYEIRRQSSASHAEIRTIWVCSKASRKIFPPLHPLPPLLIIIRVIDIYQFCPSLSSISLSLSPFRRI